MKRATWSSQLGFVIAAAASAVGLGNIWRFPTTAAKYGGGVFLAIYAILTATLGIALLSTEIAIGRSTRLAPSKCFGEAAGGSKRWAGVGWLGTLIPAMILPYYCVVGGWVLKYFVDSTTEFGPFLEDNLSEGAYTFLFGTAVIALILMGVRKGIEKSNKIMMPALLFLMVGIALFIVFGMDSGAGLKYFLLPSVERLSANGEFSWMMLGKCVLAAMGQMFFSLSIAMGIMITYGSYVPEDASIPRSTARIAACDTFVAVVAGVVVIAGAFASAQPEAIEKAGPGLLFDALPKVFAWMPFGRVLSFSFFALVIFAALTSAISIAETVTASFCDATGAGRVKGALVAYAWLLAGAAPCVFDVDILSWADFAVNNVLMPVCAFLTCVYVGWVRKPAWILDELGVSIPFWRRAYAFLIRYLAPALIAVIFVTQTLSGLGLMEI